MLKLNSEPIERTLNQWMTEELVGLRKLGDEELDTRILHYWSTTAPEHWFLLNKIMTGAFRVGVSEKLVLKALAQVSGDPDSAWHQWLMGKSDLDFEYLKGIFRGEIPQKGMMRAIPFCLAAPVENSFFEKEPPENFFAEWKWDGIRAQVIKKDESVWIWSRGEEMVSEAFPEISAMAATWDEDVILDGELIIWGEGKPRSFGDLQQRLGRKKLSTEMLKKNPVSYIAYDILHLGSDDLTSLPLHERRRILEKYVREHTHPNIHLSELVAFQSWDELKKLQAQARERGAEGLMLKDKSSPYVGGRQRGVWWKFKVQPYTLDAVLLYAQAGSGKRAGLFTDYTFALWNEEHQLVPFAKAYSGLDNLEIEELDKWIRRNTLEKFGPVRSLKTQHVFEIAFEGIGKSARHKSGVAVRFPRILRWRKDKPVEQADHLKDARKLIEAAT
jgi:DNA ligase-1